jgi:DNA-3-methyladenine glycosylase
MTAAPDSDVRQMLSAAPVLVAPRLLGWTLRHESADGVVEVELTEVEAYHGEQDPASHAYRGRTARNAAMFGPPGYLYVYRSHGLHWCCNLVTGPEGEASAILLRAGRAVEGRDLARLRRGSSVPDRRLARGPGCMCQALGITGEHDGLDLLAGGVLTLGAAREGGDATSSGTHSVERGPRVGVSRAADKQWRFWVAGDDTVSGYRRCPRAYPQDE